MYFNVLADDKDKLKGAKPLESIWIFPAICEKMWKGFYMHTLLNLWKTSKKGKIKHLESVED